MSRTVLNKRSNVVLGDGKPKIPTAEQLDYGEIAVNYYAGKEIISFKNSNNEIVAFGDEVVIGTSEPLPGSHAEIFIDTTEGPSKAVLKFKNQDGEWVALTNSEVNPIETVQTTGSSTTAVMSQNAVTVELNKKANTTDVYTKSEVNDTFLTKTDASSTYITEDTLNDYSTSTEVTQQITTAVEGKADKATTLAGYGITDAKIEGGTITLGSQTITPLTEATVGDYITSEEVDAKIAALVDSAPGTLDTLNELAAALGDDPNFATTITEQIASKADAADLADYATTEALTSGLAGKANTTHTHTVSQITDLNLGNYATTTALTEGLEGKANTSHTHAISDVTNLQNILDDKAAVTHTHTVSQITDLDAKYATKSSVLQAISDARFNNGHNAVSSVTDIPISKRLAIATISSHDSLTLAATPPDGREIHVIVNNTADRDILITMPSGSNYVKMSGDPLIVPALSYTDINVISDGTKMYIRAFLKTTSSGGFNPSQSVAGDLCFYDRTTDSVIIVASDAWNISTYPSSRYVPIGVVVVPGSHNVYGDGSCGVMSLKAMNYNSPDSGSTSIVPMYWGGFGDNISLPNLDKVPNGNTSNGIPTGLTSSASLPSDKFSGTQCAHDTDVSYYNTSVTPIPSPYLTDGSRNPGYYQITLPSSPSNALADFDGIGNSQVLWGLATSQSSWKTASSITNNSSSGYYPAACCCWRYHTEGTSQGDWYLPACGELGYIMPPFNKINEAIDKMRTAYGSSVGVKLSGSYCWSSTEYSSDYARSMTTSTGNVDDYNKNRSGSVRAWLRVGGGE